LNPSTANAWPTNSAGQQFPVVYKGKTPPPGFRADLIVDGRILIEIKALSAISPVHEAHLLTYPRLSQIRIGLLMNFHAVRLKDGLRRLIV
jgi:GxxExxY protein